MSSATGQLNVHKGRNEDRQEKSKSLFFFNFSLFQEIFCSLAKGGDNYVKYVTVRKLNAEIEAHARD